MPACVFAEAIRDSRLDDYGTPTHCVKGQCLAPSIVDMQWCCSGAGINVDPARREQTLLELVRSPKSREQAGIYLGLLQAVARVEESEGE